MSTISGFPKITSVDGNRQRLDGGAMFGNVPRALWERWMTPDDKGRVELQCRALLLEYDNSKILCETGIGAFFEPKLADRFGVFEQEHKLLANLAAAGVEPAEIDYVILSHLHFDHAGGLLPAYEDIQSGNDDLVFPNAHYIVGEEAFARAEAPHERDRASFIPGLSSKLKATNNLHLIQSDGSGLPEALQGKVSFRFSHGHTPGQMHTLVHGKDKNLFFCGDLIPGQPWVHVPITMGYDRFPELLIDEKKDLYATAVPENWWLFFTHDPKVAMARVEQNEKGRVEVAETVPTPIHFSI